MPPKVKSIRFFSLSVLEPKNTSVCLICFELLQLQETHMLHTCSSTFLLFSLCSQLISFDGFMVSCNIYTVYLHRDWGKCRFRTAAEHYILGANFVFFIKSLDETIKGECKITQNGHMHPTRHISFIYSHLIRKHGFFQVQCLTYRVIMKTIWWIKILTYYLILCLFVHLKR